MWTFPSGFRKAGYGMGLATRLTRLSPYGSVRVSAQEDPSPRRFTLQKEDAVPVCPEAFRDSGGVGLRQPAIFIH